MFFETNLRYYAAIPRKPRSQWLNGVLSKCVHSHSGTHCKEVKFGKQFFDRVNSQIQKNREIKSHIPKRFPFTIQGEMGSFVESEYFHTLAHTVFSKCDENGDGKVDMPELLLAVCRMHMILNKAAPGAMPLPTISAVKETLTKADLNADGALSLPEFTKFAQIWFKDHGSDFAKRTAIISLLYAVAIPGSAELISNSTPGGRKIPAKLIAFALTVGLKFLGSKRAWTF